MIWHWIWYWFDIDLMEKLANFWKISWVVSETSWKKFANFDQPDLKKFANFLTSLSSCIRDQLKKICQFWQIFLKICQFLTSLLSCNRDQLKKICLFLKKHWKSFDFVEPDRGTKLWNQVVEPSCGLLCLRFASESCIWNLYLKVVSDLYHLIDNWKPWKSCGGPQHPNYWLIHLIFL